MEKKQLRLSALVAGICMSLFTMTSCTSEDSMENTGTARTFMVSETTDDDALSRAAMQPITAKCDLGDGTMLVGTLTDETNGTGTRTVTTSTNTIADGTGVTYYACDTNGKILATDNVSVKDSKVTVNCPSGSSTVYFYIGSAPSGTVDNTIGSTTTTSRAATYADMYASASVSAASSALATLTFKHVFGEARVTMSSNDATTKVGDFTSSLSGIALETADIKANGTYTAQGSDQAIACSVSGDAGTGISLSSTYAPFVLTSPDVSKTATLTITKVTFGGTVKNLSSNNTMKFTSTFVQGRKYNFNVKLKKAIWSVKYDINGGKSGTVPTDANSYTSSNNTVIVQAGTSLVGQDATPNFKYWNDKQDGSGTNYTPSQGFTISSDVTLYAQWSATTKYAQGYTMWDAKAPYPILGSADQYTKDVCGASWYHKITQSSEAYPTNNCVDCPTLAQIEWYLKGGAYWGDKPSDKTYTAGDGTNITQGIWLRKKSDLFAPAAGSGRSIVCTEDQFDTSATGGVDRATMVSTKPSDLSTNWFFLPAAGQYKNGTLYNGTIGYYWSGTPNGSDNAYNLVCSSSGGAYVYNFCACYLGLCLWAAQ